MCICDISVEDTYVRLPLSTSAAWVLDRQAERSLGWRRFLKPKRQQHSRWRLEPVRDRYEVRFAPNRAPELWLFSADNLGKKRL
ncbi:hypothetical protein [Enterobacillus tribolii]|uniref:Uncharacterized protein n=1 Tax=Enterobacillus tribolii TaxID=1487935 RepID=A0A370R3C1_9GAMM|nr:hypothetical protein [Enterobacillus tribolii]MBW7983987.1 hypothetical protein [Enterobacillus tribolii]RDK96928.1 hypothetical protein C8D90_101365 [Enterobacillus tribolii]